MAHTVYIKRMESCYLTVASIKKIFRRVWIKFCLTKRLRLRLPTSFASTLSGFILRLLELTLILEFVCSALE